MTEKDSSLTLLEKTKKYVRSEMSKLDGSHDFFHIERVCKLALELAKEEKVEDLEVVELSALLHDIKDWKYSGSETAGIDSARKFLEDNDYPKEKTDLVIKVIQNIGYKTELGKSIEVFPELAVVQDADRLDAIGAVGIARTFTYGGTKNQPLYDPDIPANTKLTKEQYMNQQRNPTINHFHEKLLKLKDMMKTNAGKKKAESRHKFMELFLERFSAEVNALL